MEGAELGDDDHVGNNSDEISNSSTVDVSEVWPVDESHQPAASATTETNLESSEKTTSDDSKTSEKP